MTVESVKYLKEAGFVVNKQQYASVLNKAISQNSIKNKKAEPVHAAKRELPVKENIPDNKKLFEIDIDKEYYKKHNIIVAAVNIENIPVKMIIDTGSSFDILTESFFINNKIDKPVISRTQLMTLSGKQFTPNVEVDFEINQYTQDKLLLHQIKKKLVVCVSKMTFDEPYGISGIIGLETLTGFKSVIDLDNFKITFTL